MSHSIMRDCGKLPSPSRPVPLTPAVSGQRTTRNRRISGRNLIGSVAVIIPYRDREDHLILLLSQLHPVLQRQQLDYRIFVVEQVNRLTNHKCSKLDLPQRPQSECRV
ncbi:hypothetical protein NP493_216g03032 [Ridgeia piscesae]|uniref:Galactosyltransferase N-terminal domain-containing protein n=1 Tax=Ridgeia piscesae TaxID=27915 RepID=A0AAD9P0T1_RIDPI|nr:hypothetical protein NP493_216g03032 [Ridgeia piscesae]